MFHFPPYDLDEGLIEAAGRDRRGRFRVYPFAEVAVVLGRGSDPAVELHREAIEADGVPVLRRRGGGCAVVLDTGSVIVSVALPARGYGRNQVHFRNLSRWLIDGLGRLGVTGVYTDGISDLVLADRKVAGACIHRRKDLLYYSASLLVHPDLAHVVRYLKHPPREPAYRRGRSHTDFMGSLGSFPVTRSPLTFARALAGTLCAEDLPPIL